MSEPDSILDMSVIDTLLSLQRPGAPSILGRIAGAFERSGTTLLDELRRGLETGDMEVIRQAAHSLKSGSANAGAVKFSQAACTAEYAARDGDLAAATAAIETLESQWGPAVEALNAMVEAQDLGDTG